LSVREVPKKARHGEETTDFEFPLFSKDGDRIDILLNSTSRRRAPGKIVAVVGAGQDITELNEARKAHELIQQAAEKAKPEFVSRISHEFRTPLTPIEGTLSMINAGVFDNSPDKLISMVNIAYSNSLRLHQLLDEVLDIEKIDTGQAKL
jgi:signal transduction histidine kinase